MKAFFLALLALLSGHSLTNNLATSTIPLVISSTSTPPIAAPLISIQPTTIVQGDPVMITVNGLVATSSTVQSIVFDGKPLHIFTYDSKPVAFVGIGLNEKPAIYQIEATLSNGQILPENIIVAPRKKIEMSLGIPEGLGGNTPISEQSLVTNLSSDNAILAALPSAAKSYWTDAFRFPVADPIVTNPYGYIRKTGPYSIAHKGTDFKAATGTPVMAINGGVVTLARDLDTYGNTIVVDHGFGIMSFYMHLSLIGVKDGQMVARGEVIGKSGQTGYAVGPHLHLTVRIDGVSIDPMKFLNFF